MTASVDSFRSILNDVVASIVERAKHERNLIGSKGMNDALKGLPTVSSIRESVGLGYKAWNDEALGRGWLSIERFRNLVAQCQVEDQPSLLERWYAALDRRASPPRVTDEPSSARCLRTDLMVLKDDYPPESDVWLGLSFELLDLHGLDGGCLYRAGPELEGLYLRIRERQGERAGLRAAFALTNATFSACRHQRMKDQRQFLAMACALINIASVTGHQGALRHVAALLVAWKRAGKTSNKFADWLIEDAKANLQQQRISLDGREAAWAAMEHFEQANNIAQTIDDNLFEFPGLNSGIAGAIFNRANNEIRQGLSIDQFNGVIDRTARELEKHFRRIGRDGQFFQPMQGNMYTSELFIKHHNIANLGDQSFRNHDPERALQEIDCVFGRNGGATEIPIHVRASLLNVQAEALAKLGRLPEFEQSEASVLAAYGEIGDSRRLNRVRRSLNRQRAQLNNRSGGRRLTGSVGSRQSATS